MNKFGFCVIDNFLSNGDQILAEVHHLYRSGVFRPGKVVNNNNNNAETKTTNFHSTTISAQQSQQQLVRSDEIAWIEGTEPNCVNIGLLIQTIDSIIHRCCRISINSNKDNNEFGRIKISGRTKAMIACYPGMNSKYVRHIDNPNGDGRIITSIFYLNKNYDRKVIIIIIIIFY